VSDYTEHGSVPVEDAAVEHPPTVDEVLERQRREYPEQAATSAQQPSTGGADDERAPGADLGDDERAALDAGAEPSGEGGSGHPDLEGPNSR